MYVRPSVVHSATVYGPLAAKAAPSAVQLAVSATPEGTGAYAGWAHNCKNVGMASASTTVSVRPSGDAATFSQPVPYPSMQAKRYGAAASSSVQARFHA